MSNIEPEKKTDTEEVQGPEVNKSTEAHEISLDELTRRLDTPPLPPEAYIGEKL